MKDESALALEKYLSLANSATSPEEAATLCLSATGDPALHVFAELLSAPNVASLVGTPYESSYELLRLFAFQTYAHYAENKSSYPPLSAAHERKLRRLSVITLAGRASTLSYDSLRRCLHVTTVREVEDAVLDAVYAGLLQARLDPRAQAVEVLAAAGRDAPPRTGVADMHVLLSRWAGTARGVVAAIDDTVAAMQSASKDKMLERNVANSAAAAARDTYSVDGAAGSRDRPLRGAAALMVRERAGRSRMHG